MMETWILTFYLVGTLPPKPAFDHAGEYQTEDRCMKGGRMQLPHWQKVYGHKVYWRCARAKK